VDNTGATVSQLPATCDGPEAGPPAGPALVFAGGWYPISGSGQETCTDGETTSLPPDPGAVISFVQTGLSSLEAYGAGSASSCSIALNVFGDVASAASSSQGCEAPGTNGVVVYYPEFQLTLNEPDGGASDDGGEDAAGARAGISLTWQLQSTFTDAVKTCNSSLTYTLLPEL
jgi:hypothetical protein